jgi:hypothetical protein
MKKQEMIEVPPQTPVTALDRVNNGLSLVQRALAKMEGDPKCSTVIWSILCDAEIQLRAAQDKLAPEMAVDVHMLAFADKRGVVRKVVIDKQDLTLVEQGVNAEALGPILSEVFRLGQNDFQPQDCPSVSVGDVIQLADRYFMVAPIDFKEITKEQFDGLTPPTSWSELIR